MGYLDNTGLAHLWSKIKSALTGKLDTTGTAYKTSGIPYGECNSSSTSTVFTAAVPGITSLYDGVCVLLKNGVVTSASGFTININNLGAKPVYNSMATGNDETPTAPTRDTTIFNINYTMLFVYSEDLVSGGAWICYRGYDANTNTIGYQLRTNSGNLVAADTGYRYRIWLTSADGSKWVPINTSSATNATTARTLNTRKIDPFGPIVYNSTNGTTNANARPGVTTLWQQYTLTIGYSYVVSLTAWNPVYIKCTPQTDGSAIMQDIVQDLPSSVDGFIYIYLGQAYGATAMELRAEHPVYYHDGTGIRAWVGRGIPTKTSDLTNDSGFLTSAVTSFNGATGAVTYTAPVTSVNGSTGAVTVQATLVSGTNIKTINGNSLLGSGDLAVGGGAQALTEQEIEDAVEAAFVVPVPSGYTISYTSNIQRDTQLRSLSKDGSKVLGEYETSAVEGDIITMWFSGRWEPVVTRDDTSESITCTNTEIDASNPSVGRSTTWTFSMPAASVTIDDYYND